MFTTDDSSDTAMPLCMVVGGRSNGEIVFIEPEFKQSKSVIKQEDAREIDIIDEGKFQQIPCPEVRCIYVSGPANAGKSTWCSNYIRNYLKLYPDRKFFLFSRLDKDKCLDDLNPHRINIADPELIENPLELEEVPETGCIVLFDDCDTISNQKLLLSINNFQAQLLELGRHRNCTVLITSHLVNGNGRKQCRTVMNEAGCLVFFGGAGSHYQINYCLSSYFGMSRTQIRDVLDMKSRWISIIKICPQVVLTEKRAIFVSEISKVGKK